MFDHPDSHHDTFRRGAFLESIRQRPTLALLADHNPDRVVGIVTALAEDDIGLKFRAELFDDAPAVDRGMGVSMSVAARSARPAGVGRVIQRADIFELSLTRNPAQKRALVVETLSAPDEREQRDLHRQVDRLMGRLLARAAIYEPGLEALQTRTQHLAARGVPTSSASRARATLVAALRAGELDDVEVRTAATLGTSIDWTAALARHNLALAQASAAFVTR